jgi:hypothetical protein
MKLTRAILLSLLTAGIAGCPAVGVDIPGVGSVKVDPGGKGGGGAVDVKADLKGVGELLGGDKKTGAPIETKPRPDAPAKPPVLETKPAPTGLDRSQATGLAKDILDAANKPPPPPVKLAPDFIQADIQKTPVPAGK